MNKNILILAVCAMCFGVTATAQVDIITFNDLNYVYNSDRINFRTPSAGDMAIVVNTTINNSLAFDDQTVNLLAQDLDGTNRLAEQLIPSYRYYLSSRRCVSAGLLLGRENQIINGTTLGVDSSAVSSMVAQNKSRSLSFRVAFDQHNKPWRFRKFDLDTYFGAALSIGRTKAVEYTDIQYTDGTYLTQTATTPGTAAGGEAPADGLHLVGLRRERGDAVHRDGKGRHPADDLRRHKEGERKHGAFLCPPVENSHNHVPLFYRIRHVGSP